MTLFCCERAWGKENGSFGLWETVVSLVSALSPPVWSKAPPWVHDNCARSFPRPREMVTLGWSLEAVHCVETYWTFFTCVSLIAVFVLIQPKNKMNLVGYTCILVVCLEGGGSLWLLYPGPLAPSKGLVFCLFCSYFLCFFLFCSPVLLDTNTVLLDIISPRSLWIACLSAALFSTGKKKKQDTK